MTISKLSTVANHFIKPFDYKTPNGKEASLSKIERISSIGIGVLLTVGLALASGATLLGLGGVVFFYGYTAFLKYGHIRELEKAKQMMQALHKPENPLLAPINKLCQEAIPLRDNVKTLLASCKNAPDEATKRKQLLLLGPEVQKLERKANDLSPAINKVKDSTPLLQARSLLTHLTTLVLSAHVEMSAMIDSLSIQPLQLDEEVKLLQSLPTEMQRKRFEDLLALTYVRHPIVGDGACGARALACGIWPDLLDLRKTNPADAEVQEQARAAELRGWIADYMLGNNNLYRPYVAGRPAPEGVGEEAGAEITFEKYLEEIRKPTTYFGDHEMKVAAKAYQIPIQIYKAGAVKVVHNQLLPLSDYIAGASQKKPPIALYHNGNHYEFMTKI